MMRQALIAGIASAAMTLPAHAADMIDKVSPHSVTITMDRLAAAVEGAGATTFARVDHAAGPAKLGTAPPHWLSMIF